MAVSRLVLLYSLLIFYIISISNGDDEEEEEYPIIASITDAIRVNVNHNVTQHLNIVNYSASPNPDITILSPDYFLCIWSYIVKDETNPNLTTYSNEIYSNLFSSKDGKSMVRTEYLLNRIKGYSQDTPSATALFNETNHATHSVAVVWESQIDDSSNGGIIDAVYGRIIKWSITFTSSYRYVKVTSPTSQEFQISSPSIDYLHHQNPDVIPIYGTGKFLVSWISSFDGNGDNTKNMVFIRIYYNSGKPYSNQIQIHESDEYYKKYPRAVPLLNNLTLISWLTQSADNGLIVYGMIWDQNGQSRLINNDDDQGRYKFIEMDDDENHTIYSDTIPVIAHLYNDKYNNNNYFILGWQTRNDQDGTNCIYAAVYMYNDEDNEITQISQPTPLFDKPYYISSEYHIEYPQMENVENAIYEQEYGLDAKVALCYSLKDIKLDKSDIYCKILEITLWDNQETVDAEINLVTEEKMINTNSQLGHQHEHPQISSESALRARVDFNDNPEFVVVWSNQRQTGYDIYTRIMKLSDTEEINTNQDDGDESNDTGIFGPKFNIIVIGVVFGIILVVLCVCLCNHFYKKHKDNSINRPRNKMQQIGEESDDDNEDTIGQIGYGGHETIGHDDDDDDDDVDYGIDTGDGLQLTNQDSVTR